MPTFYGAIDLAKNELRNAVIQNLGAAPATPSKGQIYMDSTANILYWYSGSQWVAAQGGAGAVPSDTVTTQAVGDAAAQGVSALYSRGDHKHGREAFGPPTYENAFGTNFANGSATTVARSDHGHGNPTHVAADHSTIPLNSFAVPVNNVNMGSFKITSLGTPALGADAVTKSYVDNLVAGLSWKEAVRVASTAAVTLSGAQSIDGVTTATGDRVLLKQQASAVDNGVYVAAAGAWQRATDVDAMGEMEGAAVFVIEGTTQGGTAWVCTTPGVITPNTSPNNWTQFAGGGAVTAGAGMTQVGSTLNVIAGDTSLTVAADSVIVNTGVIATVASVTAKTGKYTQNLAGTSPEVIFHSLNTRDVQVSVVGQNSPWAAIEVDWEATSATTVTLRYNPNFGPGTYRVVMVG